MQILLTIMMFFIFISTADARTLYWDRNSDLPPSDSSGWEQTSSYNVRGCTATTATLCVADVTSPILGNVPQPSAAAGTPIPSFVLPDTFSSNIYNSVVVTAVGGDGSESVASNVVYMGAHASAQLKVTMSTNTNGTYSFTWAREASTNVVDYYVYICMTAGCVNDFSQGRYDTVLQTASGTNPVWTTPSGLTSGTASFSTHKLDGPLSAMSAGITFPAVSSAPKFPSVPLNPSFNP